MLTPVLLEQEQEEEKPVKRQRNDTESSDGGRKDSESDKTESSAETRYFTCHYLSSAETIYFLSLIKKVIFNQIKRN